MNFFQNQINIGNYTEENIMKEEIEYNLLFIEMEFLSNLSTIWKLLEYKSLSIYCCW